jgi:alcohol dehydrogenase (NADP+)
MANGSSIGASHMGNRHECLAMLKLAAEKKLFPKVETIPRIRKGLRGGGRARLEEQV